jgi:hypothetical protein
MINKNGVMWLTENGHVEYIIKDGDGYLRNKIALTGTNINPHESTMVAMGEYVVILPANVWVNPSRTDIKHGYMGARFDKTKSSAETQTVKLSLANAKGEVIEYKDEDYYKTNAPNNGDYMLSSVNGKAVLKEYSSATSVWNTVATTYVQIECASIGALFSKGDGVTISIKDIDNVPSIFINEENRRHSLNAVIVSKN